jgi:GST-like protein
MTTLFTVPTANGQRASIALEECGFDHQTRTVDLSSGQHRSEEMLALNPFGRMPVLQIDTDPSAPKNIYGSLAIGLHAAERSGKLLPTAQTSDDFHQWIGIIMTDLMPAFAGKFYLGTLAPEPDEWGINWYVEIIGRFLRGIDAHLADNKFFLGDDYTLVDVLMYPTAATSMAGMVEGLAPYENLGKWMSHVATRDAVARGMLASS